MFNFAVFLHSSVSAENWELIFLIGIRIKQIEFVYLSYQLNTRVYA